MWNVEFRMLNKHLCEARSTFRIIDKNYPPCQILHIIFVVDFKIFVKNFYLSLYIKHFYVSFTMKKLNKMLAGIATLAVTAGMAYAATSAVSSVPAPASGNVMSASVSRAVAAPNFTIPTAQDAYIDLSTATTRENANVEGSAGAGQCFGSTGSKTKIVFDFENTVAQPYTFVMSTGHKGTCTINLTLRDSNGGIVAQEKNPIPNTGGWDRTYNWKWFLTESLPVGNYSLELTTSDLEGSNYAGNWGKMAFYAGIQDDRDHIPGSISLDKGNYVGMRVESAGNVGYVKNDCSGTYDIVCDEAGVYDLCWGISRSNEGVATITVTDNADNITANASWSIEALGNYAPATVHLEGEIEKGDNVLKILFNAAHGSYILNFKDVELKRVADHYSCIRDFAIAGLEVTPGEGYDYNCNLPMEFDGSDLTLTFDHPYGEVALSAVKGSDNVSVTKIDGGKYTIPAPAANEEIIVTATLTPDEGSVVAYKTTYTLRIFHIGDIIMTGLNVGGVDMPADVLADVNALTPGLTFSDMVFTAMPEITATFADNSTAKAVLKSVSGSKASYQIVGTAGSLSKTFEFTVDGMHIYTPAATDKSATIKYDSALRQADGSWSNGLYTISPCNDGWDGKQFKLKPQAITISAPSYHKVKQLILHEVYDNYAAGRVASVTCDGAAAVYCPSNGYFISGGSAPVDIVVNVEGHTPGAPFVMDFVDGQQPVMWFEFVYDEEIPVTAPALKGITATPYEGRNHAVVSFAFDRVMQDAEITVAGQKVIAYGGTTTLSFPLWNLDWNTAVEVTIPVGVAKDTYGNANTEAHSIILNIGEEAAVAPIATDRFIEVADVAALRAAVASLASTNSTADAPVTIIYIHNGDYDLGSEVLHINKAYNVSLIGESEEGVLIHGTRDGISNPVFSTRYSTNIYMENFTVRNDLDFGKSERAGVGVAHYGGNLDIMKNVTLQSIQDTQVTGERGYYLNCTIHGSVDYICGGGDHFYDRCTIVHEIAGGYITAPSTSPSLKHGYVFSNCVVKGEKDYNLGRPWQNEPRAFFINTTMEAIPTADGWGSMGNLPTHFFEYGSKDANGSLLDLSVRKNSPTSTNSYSPILPEQYVSYFTVENVLGSTDSWLATDLTATLEAPAPVINSGVLSWNALPKAAGYIVYADGEMVAYTADTTYELTLARAAVADYTVRAINANGAKGEMSAVAIDTTTGITDIDVDNASAPVEYFNLRGIRVDNPSTGLYIRRQGTKVEKIYVK